MYTTFEVCKYVRNSLLCATAESLIYDWDNDFKLQNIMEIIERIKTSKWFTPIDPNVLTLQEMKELDFGSFKETDNFKLIPLWLYPFLAKELKTVNFDGEEEIMYKDIIDTDHRGGYLAYGVFPIDAER